MASNYRAVLVPEHHREAVERYIRDLEELDELEAGDRAERRAAAEGRDNGAAEILVDPDTAELKN